MRCWNKSPMDRHQGIIVIYFHRMAWSLFAEHGLFPITGTSLALPELGNGSRKILPALRSPSLPFSHLQKGWMKKMWLEETSSEIAPGIELKQPRGKLSTSCPPALSLTTFPTISHTWLDHSMCWQCLTENSLSQQFSLTCCNEERLQSALAPLAWPVTPLPGVFPVLGFCPCVAVSPAVVCHYHLPSSSFPALWKLRAKPSSRPSCRQDKGRTRQ